MTEKADEIDMLKLATMDREGLVKEIIRLRKAEIKTTDPARGPARLTRDWSDVIKTCSNWDCTHGKNGKHVTGDVPTYFGVVVQPNGRETAFSWCKKCRAAASNVSHKKRRQAFKQKPNAKSGGTRR